MNLVFPDSQTIFDFLEKSHEFTRENEYLKNKKVIDAVAKTFENREMDIDSVKRSLGVILNENQCLMSFAKLEETIDELAGALGECVNSPMNLSHKLV